MPNENEHIKFELSYDKPVLVTDYQFSVASSYLVNDEDCLIELLEMKISSDLYYNLLTKPPLESVEDALNLAVNDGILKGEKYSKKGDEVYVPKLKPF